MKRKVFGPDQRKAFRDKYLAAIIAVMAFFLSGDLFAQQNDSTRYTNNNSYGTRAKRTINDSLSMIPLYESPHTGYRPGGLYYRKFDSSIYVWTGSQKLKVSGAAGGAGIDTAYTVNDTTIAIETDDNIFFMVVRGTPDWHRTGNTGTDPSNFLGTTDERPLRFRTNNVERVIIDSSSGKVWIINGPDTLTFIAGSESIIRASAGTDLSLVTDDVALKVGGIDKLTITGLNNGGDPSIDSLLVQNSSGTVRKMNTALFAKQSALTDSADDIRSAIAGIITTVSHDATLSGDGTSGNPLKVDTSRIATLNALRDSINNLSLATRGELFSDDFEGTLSNWTETGAGDFNINSGVLEVSDPAGSNALAKYIQYTGYSSTDVRPIKITYRMIVGTVGASSNSPSVGFRSGASSGARSMYVSLNTTTGSSRGRIQWYYDNSATVYRYSDGALTVNTGDTIDVILELQRDSYIATYINRTTDEGQSLTDFFYLSRNYNGQSAGFPIAYRTSINAMGATIHKIDSFKVSSDAPTGVTMLEVGNSLTNGSLVSNFDNVASNYLNRVCRGYFYTYGGPGELTEQISASEIIALAPQKIVLRLGTNNLIALSDNAATFMGKLATLVSQLQTGGYILGTTLFIATLPPTNTNDVTAYNTSIISTYGSLNAVIDLNKTLKAFGSTGIAAKYPSVDGVHFEDYANRAIANTYINFFSLVKKPYSQTTMAVNYDDGGKLSIGRIHAYAREGLNYADPTGTIRVGNSGDDNGGYVISNNDHSIRLGANVTWDGTQYIAKGTSVGLVTNDNTQFAWTAKSGLTIGNPIPFASSDVRLNVLATGNAGINNSAPLSPWHVVEAGGFGIIHQNTSALGANSGGRIRLVNSGTPTAADQAIGSNVYGTMPNSSTLRTAALIGAYSEAAWTDNVSHPTYIVFNNVPSGSTTLTERMRISAAGNVGIGTTAPITILDVRGGSTLHANFQNTLAFSSTSGALARFINSGTPTAVDQRIGGVLFGSNPSGTTQRTGASLLAFSDGAWTDNASHPTYLQFNTVAAGSTTNTERMRIAASGNVTIGALAGTGTRIITGTSAGQLGAISNGSDGQVMTMVSGSPAWATPITLASGTYTPTVFSSTNVDASTTYVCQYLRVGNSVTVSGKIDVDCTTASTGFDLELTLPIASNFVNSEEAGGTGAYPFGTNAYGIRAKPSASRIILEGVAEFNTNTTITFQYTYQIK